MAGVPEIKEYICDDPNGCKWYYANDTYYRITEAGELERRIRGANLPDPDRLWLRRKKRRIGIPASELKPQPVTYLLWEHWNAGE